MLRAIAILAMFAASMAAQYSPPPSGQLPIISTGTGAFGAVMPNMTMPKANTTNSVSGNNDLYTVPANRKALVNFCNASNSTGGSITYQMEVKISGTYYPYSQVTTVNTVTYGSSLANLGSMVLVAGDILAVNTSALGASVWCGVQEFDSSSPISVARLTALAASANTLLTISGNGISVLPFLSAGNVSLVGKPFLYYANNSGGARTVSFNAIPNGGSVANSNLLLNAASISDKGVSTGNFNQLVGGLEPGAVISITTDANTATQFAWICYIQM